jgi:flagellar biosynthesis anti-sigma factor FlgM
MEITGMLGKLGLYGQNKVEENRDKNQEAAKAEKAEGNDQVELSTEARTLHTARAQAEEASEVRQDKVRALKEEIARGSYSPDSEQTAQKLLEEEMGFWF